MQQVPPFSGVCPFGCGNAFQINTTADLRGPQGAEGQRGLPGKDGTVTKSGKMVKGYITQALRTISSAIPDDFYILDMRNSDMYIKKSNAVGVARPPYNEPFYFYNIPTQAIYRVDRATMIPTLVTGNDAQYIMDSVELCMYRLDGEKWVLDICFRDTEIKTADQLAITGVDSLVTHADGKDYLRVIINGKNYKLELIPE